METNFYPIVVNSEKREMRGIVDTVKTREWRNAFKLFLKMRWTGNFVALEEARRN